MKKLLAILMALVFVFSFAACGSKKEGETTAAATTNAPAPKTPEAASKTVISFLNNLNAKALLELMDVNITALTAEDEFSIVVLDAIISNTSYEILSTVKKNDNAYDVKVKLSVPDTDAGLELIEEKVEKLGEENSDATPQESVKLLKDLINQAFSDTSITKNPVEQLFTVNYVDGIWKIDTSTSLVSDLENIFFAGF